VANLLDWKGAIGSSIYRGRLILCSFTNSGSVKEKVGTWEKENQRELTHMS
jgi:hypothetical protein